MSLLTYKHLILAFAIGAILFHSRAEAGTPECDKRTPVGEFCKTYDLSSIRPTQYAIGEEMVDYKRDKIEDALKDSKDELKSYLKKNPVPVVRGPDGNLYAIDHHHLTLAMIESNIDKDEKRLYIEFKADFSDLKSMDDFWKSMDAKKWVYAFDENNVRIEVSKIAKTIPTSMRGLKPDPYRSLAGVLVESGCLKKVFTPFSQFKVATYLRDSGLKVEKGKKEFVEAIKKAMELVRDPKAKAKVPGWVGIEGGCGSRTNELLKRIHYPELDKD